MTRSVSEKKYRKPGCGFMPYVAIGIAMYMVYIILVTAEKIEFSFTSLAFLFSVYLTLVVLILLALKRTRDKTRNIDQERIQNETIKTIISKTSDDSNPVDNLEYESRNNYFGIVICCGFLMMLGTPVLIRVFDMLFRGGNSFPWMVWLIFMFLLGALTYSLLFQLLSLSNPKLNAILWPGAILLGESGVFEWRFTGKTERLEYLTFILQGREKAVYVAGTDRETIYSTFYEKKHFLTRLDSEIAFGKINLSVPASSMHSFKAGNNAFEWRLIVQGAIPNRPNLLEEIEFQVLPLPIQEGNYHA